MRRKRARSAVRRRARASGRKRTIRRVRAGASPRARRRVAVRTRTRSARPKAAKRVTKRGAAKRVAKRVRVLRVVRPAKARRATKPARAAKAGKPAKAAPPAFPQRAGASEKQMLIFDLMRARAAFHAAIQGLTGGSAERPLAEGKWTVRETVLHLVCWDELVLSEIERAARGAQPPWHGYDVEGYARLNAEGQAQLGGLGWDDALRRLHASRSNLLEAIESFPEEPAEMWHPAHAFGAMLRDLESNDRHHADVVKRWRQDQGV
jgi:hypothetical protein